MSIKIQSLKQGSNPRIFLWAERARSCLYRVKSTQGAGKKKSQERSRNCCSEWRYRNAIKQTQIVHLQGFSRTRTKNGDIVMEVFSGHVQTENKIVRLQKSYELEREKCMQLDFYCLCRQSGHSAKHKQCPKNRVNRNI